MLWDQMAPSSCGDDLVLSPEVCDGECLAGETCESQGFDGGNLGCFANCTGFDTSECSDCGNDQIEPPEVCDGDALDGESCQSQGFDAGDLACLGDCTGFDLGGCYFTDQAPRYTGKYLDDHTGLSYFGARYMEARLGRFTQPDLGQLVLSKPQTLNRFAYSLNSPYRFGDPDGRQARELPILVRETVPLMQTPSDGVTARGALSFVNRAFGVGDIRGYEFVEVEFDPSLKVRNFGFGIGAEGGLKEAPLPDPNAVLEGVEVNSKYLGFGIRKGPIQDGLSTHVQHLSLSVSETVPVRARSEATLSFRGILNQFAEFINAIREYEATAGGAIPSTEDPGDL